MITETISLLGHKATDKITGFSGTITSVCFDLYGCVQVALYPPMDKAGKVEDGRWYDVNRLEVAKGKPVMSAPDFDAKGKQPERYDSGPADKPAVRALPAR